VAGGKGDAAGLLRRQAVREAEADLALAAVDLLEQMEAADLPALVDGRLATMGIGPSRWWRVDDIRIHLGPAEEIHASD
jgi:hypothetical protein